MESGDNGETLRPHVHKALKTGGGEADFVLLPANKCFANDAPPFAVLLLSNTPSPRRRGGQGTPPPPPQCWDAPPPPPLHTACASRGATVGPPGAEGTGGASRQAHQERSRWFLPPSQYTPIIGVEKGGGGGNLKKKKNSCRQSGFCLTWGGGGEAKHELSRSELKPPARGGL